MARISAALVDVETGFVFGLMDATDAESQPANGWTHSDAVAQSYRRAECNAFEGLADEFAILWQRVLDDHAPAHGYLPGQWDR